MKMGRKGLRYRLTVYLGVGSCILIPAFLLVRHDLALLLVGLYLPAVFIEEFGMVPIISRHGGVENARRKGFKERLIVNLVMAVCWILVALLLGWYGFILVIIGLVIPLLVMFDLLFIYRIFSKPRNSPRPSL
jgi:hypothetical protein